MEDKMKKNRVILLTIAACVPAFIQAMDGAQGEEPPAKRQKTNQHFCPYSPGRPPYSDAAGLRNHLRNKHAQNNVFCPICHKGFKTRHGVQLHQAITHIQETAGAATQPAPTNVLSPLDTFSVETSTTTVTALPQQTSHPAPTGLPQRTTSFEDILAELQTQSSVAPQQMSWPASVQMQQQQMQQTLGSAPIATTLPQDLLLGDESNLTSPPLANVAIAAAALTQASDTAFEQTQEEKEAIYQQWLNMHPRPRQCPFARCPFSSDKTSNMKRHITCVHLQLKPFRCDACGIRYGQKKNLKIHIETTHQ